jgi:hypothetical protein
MGATDQPSTTNSVANLAARWALPAVWITLPFTAGGAFADALAGRDRPVQLVASLGLWICWGVALAAMGVPRTTSLTLVRVIVPTAAAATFVAGLTDQFDAAVGLALLVTGAATVWCLNPLVGDHFVNGSSYGEERRYPLRPPTALLLGPIEATWAAVVAAATVGPLLLAAGQWLPGAIATVGGAVVVAGGGRILHGLSRRWLVFVPAGVVLHDPAAMADPLLATPRELLGIGLAQRDTTAEDLTLGVTGLAVEVRFREPLTFAPRPKRGHAVAVRDIEALLCAPSRPGAVLRDAASRRLPVH